MAEVEFGYELSKQSVFQTLFSLRSNFGSRFEKSTSTTISKKH